MQATSIPAPAGTPVQLSERIQFLDVLRGIALLGILFVNMRYMGLTTDDAEADLRLGESLSSEAWVPALIRAFAENKFMGLFSLLFGMGLALQVDRAEARGVNPNSFYPARIAILAAFGVLNGVYLFMGDILLPYAVAGTLVYLLRKLSQRTHLILAAVCFGIGICLSVLVEGLGDLWGDGEGDGGMGRLGETLAHGSFFEAAQARRMLYVFWLFISSIIAFNWRILALFFLGLVVMRRGWAKPEAHLVHRRAMKIGLSIGVTLELLSMWLHADPDPTIGRKVADILIHNLGGPFLSAGYAGAIALWCNRNATSKLATSFASAGRMALTNYLGQNLITSLLFCGYGLGYMNQFTHLQLAGLTLAIFVVQVLLSTLWLTRFRGGPLELLWRRLTYS